VSRAQWLCGGHRAEQHERRPMRWKRARDRASSQVGQAASGVGHGEMPGSAAMQNRHPHPGRRSAAAGLRLGNKDVRQPTVVVAALIDCAHEEAFATVRDPARQYSDNEAFQVSARVSVCISLIPWTIKKISMNPLVSSMNTRHAFSMMPRHGEIGGSG
jgi:hypothetical protein